MDLIRGCYAVISELANQWKEKTSDLAKIEGTIYYIKLIELTRRLLLVVYLLAASFLAFVFCLILIHITLLLVLPLPETGKSLVAAGLIILDLVLAVWGFLIIFSQKNWLQFTRAEEMLESVTSKENEKKEEPHVS